VFPGRVTTPLARVGIDIVGWVLQAPVRQIAANAGKDGAPELIAASCQTTGPNV